MIKGQSAAKLLNKQKLDEKYLNNTFGNIKVIEYSHNKGYRKYYKGVPMAMAMKGNVFTIKINSIKMMDSSRVFGSKILWERDLPFSETV